MTAYLFTIQTVVDADSLTEAWDTFQSDYLSDVKGMMARAIVTDPDDDAADVALHERLGDAWEAGFMQGHEAGQGLDYIDNPYRVRQCGMESCTNPAAPHRKVCDDHVKLLSDLLAVR